MKPWFEHIGTAAAQESAPGRSTVTAKQWNIHAFSARSVAEEKSEIGGRKSVGAGKKVTQIPALDPIEALRYE